jgi:hypothetical protein
MPQDKYSFGSILDFMDDTPSNIKSELADRTDELSALEEAQIEIGTTVPQLYGSLSRFVANPSTVSSETFKRMIDTDETLGAGIDFLIMALIARFGDYTHPVPEVQQFVRSALNKMQGSWHANLEEMFSAEWGGFSVTEKVWQFVEDFDGAPAFVPKKLVTYPQLTVVFAVDRHGEVLPDGIYQYQRFHNSFFNSNVYGVSQGELDGFRPDSFASIGDLPYPVRIAADLTYLTVKITKDKVIHLRSSTTGKFNNPYGRSVLRRAYKSWVAKDAFLKMWIIAADRKGTPLTVGYAAPNETVIQENQQSHGPDGAPQLMDTASAMANTFKHLHNESFIVLPGKKGETYEVEALQTQGDMNVFKDGVEYFNKSMMRALLIPPLVMGTGDGSGSWSLGSEHKKIFNQIIDGKLKPYKQDILDQLIQPLIAYNFPRKLWEKHGNGDFLLEEYDPEVMEKLAGIFSQLTTDGYMSPENQVDMDEVRLKMNLKKAQAKQPIPEDPMQTQHPEEDAEDPIPDINV